MEKPVKNRRHSIRLKDYDYSQPGAYFFTICVQDHLCLLGNVTQGSINLNKAGLMVLEWWKELARKFAGIRTDAFVVMPNHIHGIIEIIEVGATLCGRPGQPHRAAPTLGTIIDWFKTMTTNEYIRGVRNLNWPKFNGRFWQRSYYEHVIRDEKQLQEIREYILGNLYQWQRDAENPNRIDKPVSFPWELS